MLRTKALGFSFQNNFNRKFSDRTSKNSRKGTIKFLELLDKQGADFSSADGEGQTPLHLATNARNHDGACVKYLIKKINRKLCLVIISVVYLGGAKKVSAFEDC